ncbi:MAG TPA: lysyl oxidase family protein [Polyangiaceae bacterium]
MGDLTITAQDVPLEALSTLSVPEGSCSIQQGCVNGSGARQVAHLAVEVSNVGDLPVEIGEPWDNPAFYHSSCAQQYLLPNFIQAEVLDQEGGVVASGHLPTSCLADDAGGAYSCSVQGLSPEARSQQPQNSCDTLDLTGLLAGNYTLRLTVNADRSLGEEDFENNSVEVALNLPECDGNYCGGVCCPSDLSCVDAVCMAPDLRPHQGAVEDSVFVTHRTFGENSCEIAEACVGGPGRRRLLNFEGRIENLGPGDLNPGPERDNPLYELSECHGHYHFLDFTDYRLLDGEGAVAAQGHKQAFCLVDMVPVEDYTGPSPGEHPEPGPTGCSYLSAGWADIYGVGTDCQWVDVTDVPAGNYVLQVAVNPLGRVSELNIANNIVQVPVYLPEAGPCQEEVCGDIVDQDCDGNQDKYDSDCHEYYEAECCNAENTCNWDYNGSCDCNGEYDWDYWACYYYGGEGGAGGGSGGGPGGECCSMEDPCDWAGDGFCDCGGEFPWDEDDCGGFGGGPSSHAAHSSTSTTSSR